MDFLSKAASELSDIFKSMTPGARITAGLLLVMIVISLIYLVVFQGSGADRYLFGSREFSDEDIATMQRAFAAANLDDYKLDGKRVQVPGGKLTEYMQALDKAGFSPSDPDAAIDDILERGSSLASLIESEGDKEFRRSQAQQKKLQRTISKRPEVDYAIVQYREVEHRGWPLKTERTASVAVSGLHLRPLERSTLRTIREMASAWFGIAPENVAVTDINGGALPVGEEGEGLSREARLYADAKRYYDEYYRNQLRQCLSYLGEGVVTTVNVEMDPTVLNESSKVTVDPQTVALESESITKTKESAPTDGGRPGAVPNEVPGNEPRTLATSTSQKTSVDENSEQQVSVTGHEQIHEKKAGLRPTTVTATVSIPRSYFTKVWRERNPPANGEEPGTPTENDLKEIENEIIPKVEEKVVQALPLVAPGEDQYDQVEVSSYDDLPVPPLEPPSMPSIVMTWFSDNWKTLGLFAVAVGSLFVLRGMVRAAMSAASAAVPEPTPQDIPAGEPDTEEEGTDEEMAMLNRRTQPKGTTLHAELTSMVREDPDAAANILRTWIGDAA